MRYVIVSRHSATIEFLRSKCPELAGAAVVALATPDDVCGRVVAGNLPLHLAVLAAEVWAVEFTGTPPRGQEYGIEEMKVAGARIGKYMVEKV
jgi:Putative CRISPR-associated protein (Cas_VVA1548)